MHIIITHVYICPKTGYTARKMTFFITCQDRQTQLVANNSLTERKLTSCPQPRFQAQDLHGLFFISEHYTKIVTSAQPAVYSMRS